MPGLGQVRWVCLRSHLPCISPTRWEWDSLAHFTDEEVKVGQQHQPAGAERSLHSEPGGILGVQDSAASRRGPLWTLEGRPGWGLLEGFSERRISCACFCP